MKQRLLYIGNQLAARGGTPTSVDVLGPLLKAEGYSIRMASGKRNHILRLLEMILLVLRFSRSTDVVLIDTYSTMNFWYACTIGRICDFLGLPYIPILHGGNLPERLKNSPRVTRRFFSQARISVSPSPYLQRKFLDSGFSNVRFIPNSIRLSYYPFKERRVLKPRLLWVRSFSEFYNPFTAIQVLELLLERYSSAELCMVGPSKDNSYLHCRKYATQKNLPVRFTGKMEKGQWVNLSQDYDIFLNTTSIDNTPVSVIEAMALGLPIVSTGVGGIPYLVRDQKEGLLVPGPESHTIAEAVEKLLEDSERAGRMAVSARKRVEDFDWEFVKHMWNELLSEKNHKKF